MTSYFCIPVPYNEKNNFFLEGLVGLHRIISFSFFSITGQGIDLDNHDIEWFALDINRDHSVEQVAKRRYPMSKVRSSNCEEIPHVEGQRNPSKMVGGANSHLESNPIPARDAQRTQTNVVRTRTQGPHRDSDRTAFEPSSNNSREDSTHGHHQMVNTKTRLILFFAAKDGEALYSQQK